MKDKQFGRLTVIERVENYITPSKNQKSQWLCRCKCGKEIKVRRDCLMAGHTNSCGCYNDEKKYKHGMSDTKLYKVWNDMKNRCYNTKRENYLWYGMRGITVCEEWRNNAKSFLDWALSNGYRQGLDIDRIDNNGNYEPNNCRFVTHQENCNNR